MNIFVENNGPYVYRSIFRKIPRLRQQQPVDEEHAGTDRCHACGAPIDIQGYSVYTTPAEPEFEPCSASEPEPEPQPSAAESDQQPSELQQEHQQQHTAESIAELDAKTFVPVARVLEIFQFLLKPSTTPSSINPSCSPASAGNSPKVSPPSPAPAHSHNSLTDPVEFAIRKLHFTPDPEQSGILRATKQNGRDADMFSSLAMGGWMS